MREAAISRKYEFVSMRACKSGWAKYWNIQAKISAGMLASVEVGGIL
jgi:hypothetical protein